MAHHFLLPPALQCCYSLIMFLTSHFYFKFSDVYIGWHQQQPHQAIETTAIFKMVRPPAPIALALLAVCTSSMPTHATPAPLSHTAVMMHASRAVLLPSAALLWTVSASLHGRCCTRRAPEKLLPPPSRAAGASRRRSAYRSRPRAAFTTPLARTYPALPPSHPPRPSPPRRPAPRRRRLAPRLRWPAPRRRAATGALVAAAAGAPAAAAVAGASAAAAAAGA